MWLSLFSGYPGGSPSQLIGISGVLLCVVVFLASDIFRRKASSESHVLRRRLPIGGRNKTNTLPLPSHVQSRPARQLRWVLQLLKMWQMTYTCPSAEFSSHWAGVRREAPRRCWKRVVTVVLIFTSRWLNVLTLPKLHSWTKGNLIFTKHEL